MLAALFFMLAVAIDAGAAAGGLFAVTPTRPPPPGPAEYQLKPAKGGGYEYDGSRFSARVAPDGQVSFSDKHLPAAIRWLPFLPEANPPGTKTLEGSIRDLLNKRRRRQPSPQALAPLPQSRSANEPISSRDPGALPLGYPAVMIPFVQVGFKFDLYDEYLRLLGDDPYRFEKGRFLAATFDHRMRMASTAHADAIRRSLAELPRALESIWENRSYTERERKRIVCALWAEIDVKDPSGPRAAAIIEDFLRHKLGARALADLRRAEGCGVNAQR